MEKFEGTPGDWIIDKPTGVIYAAPCPDGGGNVICIPPDDTQYNSKLNWPANAALISAAPDLLEALEEVIKMQEDNYGDGIATHLKLAALHPKLLTAITKATTINQS